MQRLVQRRRDVWKRGPFRLDGSFVRKHVIAARNASSAGAGDELSLVDPVPQSSQFIALQRVIAGRFSLDREIGRGGQAVIYLARDVSLNRPVAIKVLNPDAAAHPKLRQHFTHEARTAGKLSQPNIVPVHAVEEHGDIVFFVMGYVDGETLGQRIKRTGMLEIGEASRILRDVAWALGYAHARGIIHRDVKPDNIMIERDSGRAIVTDFGIALHVDDEHGGEIVGTADYMSPEQAAGQPVDARSDIYSLGVTAFHAITGRLPFNASSDEGVLLLHETQPPPSMIELRAGIPSRLVEIVDSCLAKDPDDRFATAEELAAALGDTAGALRRVPPVVEDFLLLARSTSRRLTVLAPFGGILSYALGALDGFGFGHVMLIVFIGWIGVLECILPPLTLLKAARRVLLQGISYDEFCEMLKLRTGDVPGTLVASGARPNTGSARTRLLLASGGLAVALAAFVVAGARAVPVGWRPGLTSLGVSGVILASGALAWAASTRLGNPANATMRHGLWLSPLGRWFFRLATLGMGKASLGERPSIRPPETLLSQAVRTALADLDGLAQREETLAVINELEARVGMLRTERDSADLGLEPPDEASGSPFPRLMPARPTATTLRGRDGRLAANREIEVAMAALEAIRLHLVRIRSGIGSHEELRSDLTAARRIAAPRGRQLTAPMEKRA